MKGHLILFACLLLAGCGLIPSTHSSVAQINESVAPNIEEFKYQIILTGNGHTLVHDPVSLLFTPPHKYQHEIFVNSISSRIDSTDLIIRRVGNQSGSLGLVGFIEFDKNNLIINMKYSSDSRDYQFNGLYRVDFNKYQTIPSVKLIVLDAKKRNYQSKEAYCFAQIKKLSPQGYCDCLGIAWDENSNACFKGNVDMLNRIVP